MREVGSIAALRAWLAIERDHGNRIGFVPTMGYLHEGHLSLVDAARRESDAVVMSLFVNPLQFAPGEDFDRYPRDLQRDRALAAGRGVAVLFVPAASEIYDAGADLRIAAGHVAARWEGAVRPGHFDGVLTVVAKLFNIVQPDIAYFGQKDIQQVTLIRRMIQEFNFPVRLVVVPTVREPDGLAMSSRNVYLGPSERESALALSRALRAAEATWRAGETDTDVLRHAITQVLATAPGLVADYIAIVEPAGLVPVARAAPGTVIALAARIGLTRLIDNVILGDPDVPRTE
jgi:pantoate--beta-alanine ligase